jgi:hypothetical protein
MDKANCVTFSSREVYVVYEEQRHRMRISVVGWLI